jgi:hypothetical protein
MRLRLAPLAIAVIATSIAAVAAVGVATFLLPIMTTVFARGGSAGMIGVWVAVFGGVGTALALVLYRKGCH